jgi:multiple sugar transport system permease protein
VSAPTSAVTEAEPREGQAAVRRRRRVTPGSVVATVLRYIALIASAVLFLLPFYLIVRNALSKDTDITAPGWTVFPKQLHWENFAELFTDPSVNILRSLANSAIIAVLQTAGILLLCSMAGYGLARIPYRWATPIFYATLVTLMIPPAVTFIPSFIIVSQLRCSVASQRSCSASTSSTSRAASKRRRALTGWATSARSGGWWCPTQAPSSQQSQ